MLIPSWMSRSRNWESRYFFVKIDENSVPELIVLVLRVICSIGSLSLNDID
ncbi:BnaA06g38930D [Brassica napus]|uniref:BnaA06g38930D protein n=1 Tax=Brassica napus TaxID=3708 RepID=A0A078JAK1_BRANA|nr:BnaA06g38930D [Brassica napus]